MTYSALANACFCASLPMVKLLIEHGAALVTPSLDGDKTVSVLQVVRKCQEGDEVMRYLIQVSDIDADNKKLQ